jgi:hypothetical protein
MLLEHLEEIRGNRNIGRHPYILGLSFLTVGADFLAVVLGRLAEVEDTGHKVFGAKLVISLALRSQEDLNVERMAT